MFKIFKKSVEFHSPIVGKVINIEDVEDKMFASKLLGEGVAFLYETDTLYAPCDSDIIMIAATKHAIGFRTGKVEFMIHIGLDTVNLAGEGFHLLVAQGDSVKQGQPIVTLNRAFFKEKGVSLVTPLVITSTDCLIEHYQHDEVDLNSIVLKIQ